MTKPKTIVTLTGTDSALVMRANGTYELIAPDGEPGTPVPAHVVLLIAIAERIADIEFCEELVEHMVNETRHPVPGMGLPN